MQPRFVADCMVGRLAKWLRALGLDVMYHPFAADADLLRWAREREAILLTRDTRLARSAREVRVVFVRHDRVEDQVRQVVAEVPLDLRQVAPLTRCVVCNTPLARVEKEAVRDKVPPYVWKTQEAFATCGGCGRIYWAGTHVQRMRERLARLVGEAE